jgi:AcrR family transcriptional regulator
MKASKRKGECAEAPPKKSRKLSRAGVDTRGKLLDAAERLFANKGYDGASLRDIADSADQHLALTTYHFGSKERLFEEVIQRRAAAMEKLRLGTLEQIDMTTLSPAEAVRALIEAYALPIIRARYGSSRQWQAHVRLISQLISIKRWVPLIRKYYDNCAQVYIAKFEEVLPHADRNDLLDSFSFMISDMLYVCYYTNRFSHMKNRSAPLKEQIAVATENFLRFTQAGFMALEEQQRSLPPDSADLVQRFGLHDGWPAITRPPNHSSGKNRRSTKNALGHVLRTDDSGY